VTLVLVFALLQACASAQPGAGPADASTGGALDASGPTAADGSGTAAAEARVVPEETVKVMVYKSREALGLLDSLVPKKFHFEVYMLVGIGEAVELPDAATPKKKAIKIHKAEELGGGDPAELVQALPAGTFYQKQEGKMLVIVHLVKDARDLPGVCPEGTPPKPAAPPAAADPPVILWRIPTFDGPVGSTVLETVLPCPPLPQPAAPGGTVAP
jgi:hypothetical protein